MCCYPIIANNSDNVPEKREKIDKTGKCRKTNYANTIFFNKISTFLPNIFRIKSFIKIKSLKKEARL